MSRILGIGIATVDIIHSVDHYPLENSEQRALTQSQQRGGNVTNSLVVLSQLGHHCSWAGSYADDMASQIIRQDLQRHAIDFSASYCQQGASTPLSMIIRCNDSRTIIHYRDLNEYAYEHFFKIDLNRFDWLHFEGRNIAATRAMLEQACQKYPHLPRSIEIEKPRADIDSLFALASVLIFSQAYVKTSSASDPESFLRTQHAQLPNVDLSVPWGDQGAYFMTASGHFGHCPAFPPTQIVDTLGAGDTFNAGLINAYLNNHDLGSATQQACQLAGRKCGQPGLDFINHHEHSEP